MLEQISQIFEFRGAYYFCVPRYWLLRQYAKFFYYYLKEFYRGPRLRANCWKINKTLTGEVAFQKF